MRYRISFLAGLAAGFLVGARAGREYYEKIVKASRRVKDSPAVRQATKTATAKTTELTKTAASRVPKLVETAKTKASDSFDHLPGRHASHDHTSVNGSRTPVDD
jgi:hypothetical protein